MKNNPTNQTPPEKLFDPNQYGNWLTGEPKATWGAFLFSKKSKNIC